jgi:protein-S-isoprenylcysteine O-methyltransferase Ste14
VTENELLLLCAGVCFGSFGWGMVWHFGRLGRPSRAMLVTALLGLLCASLQMMALASRHLRFPVAAVVAYTSSVILFWWAVRVTRRKLAACGQGAVSHEVVTAGPYRYIRHPFYTSYNLAWVAGFVATAWWPLAIALAVMAELYARAAREEERGFSTSPLAEEYAAYKRRVGRFLPRIGTRRRQDQYRIRPI